MADAILRIISRAEALELGLKRYFTGEPCAHGHVAERNVGRNNECIACKRIRDTAYSAARKQEKSDYDRRYRESRAPELSEKKAAYRQNNRDEINRRARAAAAEDPERFRRYREKYADKRKEVIRNWRRKNRARVSEYSVYYKAFARSRKTNYWLSSVLRQRLAMAVRAGAKGGSAVADLGCSIEELRSWLESLFQPGMTWDNWGRKGWHIDHVKPLAAFDLSDPKQLAEACHYSNLQPLWAHQNIAKGAKV